jgi:hypothetical protein
VERASEVVDSKVVKDGEENYNLPSAGSEFN